MSKPLRWAVVGCGALGSFYGAKLARTGQEVHFLLRSDYEVVRERGVEIRDAQGSFRVYPKVARRPEEIGVCDGVIIGLKTTANHAFGQLIPPLVGPDTFVLTLQNGLGNEEALAACVGDERVMGGLCVVCLNRTAPGVVLHLAHGRIVMGEYRRPPGARLERVAGYFREGGIPVDVADDLDRAHWEKLVWNIPFNGLGVAAAAGYESVLLGHRVTRGPWGPCAGTDVLLGEERWAGLVRELMDETIAGARALGLQVEPSMADLQLRRTREMGPYKASTLIDFERQQPLEVESLFGEPLRRMQSAGVQAPRLAALYRLLCEMAPITTLGPGSAG